MPRYEHDGYVIISAAPLSEEQVRARVAASRAEDAAEEAALLEPDTRTETQRRDERLLAEKFAEPIGPL